MPPLGIEEVEGRSHVEQAVPGLRAEPARAQRPGAAGQEALHGTPVDSHAGPAGARDESAAAPATNGAAKDVPLFTW